MLQPHDESLGEASSSVYAHTENASEDPSVASLNDSEQPSDQSTSHYLVQVQLSHKQINKRFTELLNLFEGYTKIMDGDQKHEGVAANQLKRVPSHDQNERLSAGTASERTIQAASCEVSIQTSWTLLEQQKNDSKAAEEGVSPKEKPSRLQQHTIHIEVASVTSATDMQRAPLHHRLWHVLLNAVDALIGCLLMMGENVPYLLFILVCVWCLYLLLAHYRKFLTDHIIAVEPPK
ncbi:uncharacterized protein LOC111080552 [Drosophila obscura]|uniref:uncharacterized protein LOC111080552 n=1 Tax=Drosophila obscura TaxID=7282 RepID=UPI001BB0F35D|nr:uncharacterized protein LOC111080552 [Drosophila obscura]